MHSVDDLLDKLKEIADLIRKETNPDGTCDFDVERIFMSLEIARRMFD